MNTQLDPDRSAFVAIVGKKGQGKSELARTMFESYPYDRLVIDPTGDIHLDGDVTKLAAPLPGKFPVDDEGKQVTARFVPDPGLATYRDDMDRAVGLAFYHPGRRCLCWIDEIGELSKANNTPPHLARALHQGRHRRLSLLMCGPRPINIDPLVLAQADQVYIFRLPNPADRKRVADVIGVEPGVLDDAVANLGNFEYLRFDAHATDPDDELVHFPPLPLSRARAKPVP